MTKKVVTIWWKETELFNKLLPYSLIYEINFQMWPDYYTIFISKDSIDLWSYGSSTAIETMQQALDYFKRIKA